MINYKTIERSYSEHLALEHRPVAIAFRETPPLGISKFEGVMPSGCSFWPIASGGRTFYTTPSDHFNCPVGAYTHNISLPLERAQELDQTLGLMADISYVRMEEVPEIPRLPNSPGAIVYSPLADAPIDPDVVLFWGPPGRLMLLQEAAIRAGLSSTLTTLPRPTCMALPTALGGGQVASVGCIGNRVYTDLDDGELYVAMPGKDVGRVAEHLQAIRDANAQLSAYHHDRRQKLTAR
jgi:uncharacterized protein (DUF169 family)